MLKSLQSAFSQTLLKCFCRLRIMKDHNKQISCAWLACKFTFWFALCVFFSSLFFIFLKAFRWPTSYTFTTVGMFFHVNILVTRWLCLFIVSLTSTPFPVARSAFSNIPSGLHTDKVRWLNLLCSYGDFLVTLACVRQNANVNVSLLKPFDILALSTLYTNIVNFW